MIKEKTITKNATVPALLSYQQLDILHALRGFCAFYVVVYHAKFILWSGGTEYLRAFPRAGWNIWQYGAFGIDMLSSAGYEMVIFFLVLSGFFIRYAQLKKHRKALRFYLNRIVRIYPPYLASLALAGVVLAYLATSHPHLLATTVGRELNNGLLPAWLEISPLRLQAIARAFVFMSPSRQATSYFAYNNVYWSLLPEALFYLLVPLALWRVRYYYILSAIFYAIGFAISNAEMDSNVLVSYVFMYNGYFALGFGLYDVVTNWTGWLEYFKKVNGLVMVLVICTLLLMLIAIAAMHQRKISAPLAAVVAVVSVSTLLAGRVNRQNILFRVFHEMGIFSFSLYLYHFPFLLLSYAGLVAFTGDLVNYSRYYWLMVPVVTLFCYALYYVTERLAVRFFRGT